MRLHGGNEEFEAVELGPDLLLLRGALGGQRPELIHPAALTATVLPDRRHATRRFARCDRRKHPRNDRRGIANTWLEQKGRRRSDVFSVEDDRQAAEALARVRRRLGVA